MLTSASFSITLYVLVLMTSEEGTRLGVILFVSPPLYASVLPINAQISVSTQGIYLYYEEERERERERCRWLWLEVHVLVVI